MYGLPEGVMVLHEDPFNVEGQVAWFCRYPSAELASRIATTALESEHRGEFLLYEEDPNCAQVRWLFRGSSYTGHVLVDSLLKPLGYCIEVHHGDMVFNLHGDHIPMPRFNDSDPQIRELVY